MKTPSEAANGQPRPGIQQYHASHDSQPTSLALESGMHPDLSDSVTVAASGLLAKRGWGTGGVGHTVMPSRA